MINSTKKLSLCIDVGNTNTVFAIYDGNDFIVQWRTLTVSTRTADQYFVWLQQLMLYNHIKVNDVADGIISCVVPATVYNLKQLFKKYFNTKPYVVGTNNCVLDVEIFLDSPAEVGADRLVNAVAAYEAYGENLIVVDFGTATTFDIIGHQGSYHGGVIAPGINLSIRALQEAAARLPTVEVQAPLTVIGKNTVHAMQSGIYWGYISLIEGICARIENEWKKLATDLPGSLKSMTIIATGGLAPLFSKGTHVIQVVDQDMTIRGLQRILAQQH